MPRSGKIDGMKLPMRFNIRDLLWLTLLAAILVAWWIDRRGQSQRIEELEKRHFVYFYDDIQTVMPKISPARPGQSAP